MDNTSCKIRCSGSCIIGENWFNTAPNGYNRLYYINGGSGYYVRNGESVPFVKGMLYFIPFYSNVVTFSSPEDNLDHTYSGFYLTPPIISTDVFCLDPNVTPCVRSATDTFCTLCRTWKPRQTETELLKATIIYLCNTAAQASGESLIADTLIIQALDLIHSTVSQGLSVAEIARISNMSTNGFIKKFTKYVGETPYSYIKKLKLRTALMLRNGGATLEEAAAGSGYSDASALLHAMSRGIQ